MAFQTYTRLWRVRIYIILTGKFGRCSYWIYASSQYEKVDIFKFGTVSCDLLERCVGSIRYGFGEFNFCNEILAQFHARDTVLSEQLDYFGAILLVYSTFTIVYARQLFRYDFTSWLLLLPLACFILHIYYLFYFLPKFEFGLNMQICVFLGLCTV